ncbi:MAG TPA: CamS family sex pheromone protein [Pseudogracilibacillus sp.]|nr:CamS family sex pheromone protein [Pseudogracilibacillus sp.]
MKRLSLLLIILSLIISGCGNILQDDTIEPEEEGETEISIIPSHSLEENQYKILLPYRPSAARGSITNQITNRVDIDELEEGLRRHSINVFSPEKYVFEEGQYLSTEQIFDLIDSLNPDIKDSSDKKEHEKNPRVFSHILEQNFLERKENRVDLVGVSIGISLKSVYRYQTEVGGPYFYEDISEKEMLQEGEKIAQSVLKEIRATEGLEEIPVMIALFREAEQSSPVPGNFMQKTVVGKGEQKIGKWENINEEYILFPSREAKERYTNDYQKVKAFSEKIDSYFPNYVGVVGTGFYVEDELKKLAIEVPIEFYGKGEIIGFTQYVYGIVQEIFANHYDIEVSVYSSEGAESLIFRDSGEEEPTVHIFH